MTDTNDTKTQGIAPPKPTPNPALKRLNRLVGTWKMKGGPVGSNKDSMTGTFTISFACLFKYVT